MTQTTQLLKLIETVVMSVLAAGIPVALIAVWIKRRHARRRLAEVAQVSEPLQGTLEELKRAEAEASAQPLDMRQVLLKDHVLLDRFATSRGFSRTYMEDLIRKFDAAGITAALHFQETVPMGYLSLVEQHGVFELYVPVEAEDAAKQLLQRELQTAQ